MKPDDGSGVPAGVGSSEDLRGGPGVCVPPHRRPRPGRSCDPPRPRAGFPGQDPPSLRATVGGGGCHRCCGPPNPERGGSGLSTVPWLSPGRASHPPPPATNGETEAPGGGAPPGPITAPLGLAWRPSPAPRGSPVGWCGAAPDPHPPGSAPWGAGGATSGGENRGGGGTPSLVSPSPTVAEGPHLPQGWGYPVSLQGLGCLEGFGVLRGDRGAPSPCRDQGAQRGSGSPVPSQGFGVLG